MSPPNFSVSFVVASDGNRLIYYGEVFEASYGGEGGIIDDTICGSSTHASILARIAPRFATSMWLLAPNTKFNTFSFLKTVAKYSGDISTALSNAERLVS